MGFNVDIAFQYGLWDTTSLASRVGVAISPGNPTTSGDQTIAMFFILQNGPAAGSFDVAQSGDLIDADFDDTLVNAIAAAAALTTGVTFDGVNTISFDETFLGVFRVNRDITSDPAVGLVYTLTISNAVGDFAIGVASASFVTTDVVVPPTPSLDLTWGMNQSGGDFGQVPGVQNVDYAYPKTADILWDHARGIRAWRIPVKKQRLQEVNLTALDEADMEPLDELFELIASFADGSYGLFDPHHQGHVANVKIGDAGMTVADWVDFLSRVGLRYQHLGSAFFLQTMNEPQSPATGVTWTAADWMDKQVDIYVGLRNAGVTCRIVLVGASWTGMHSWVSFGNAAAFDARMGDLPDTNWMIDVHQYLDRNHSGTYEQSELDQGDELGGAIAGSGSTVGVAFTDWARASLPAGVKAQIGEMGIANTESSLTENLALINFCADNSDVFETVFPWGGGARWPDNYFFRMSPIPDSGPAGVDTAQMRFYMNLTLPIATQQNPTDIGLSNSVSSVAFEQGEDIGFLSGSDPNPQDFFTYELTDDVGGKYQLQGAAVQTGATARTVGIDVITVRMTDRGGNFIDKDFSMAVTAAPTVAISKFPTAAINEGQNATIRHTIGNPQPGCSYKFWCSGGVVNQFVGTFLAACQAAFEPMGYIVEAQGPARVLVRMTNSSVAGVIPVVWQSKADSVTEGSQFNAAFFIDAPVGVTLGSSVVSVFINDTSLTPAWNPSFSPTSIISGGSSTFSLLLTNPQSGMAVTLAISGDTANSDFPDSVVNLIAAAAAQETSLSFDTGTGVLSVTGSGWDGRLDVTIPTIADADADEILTITLSDPVNTNLGTATSASLIVREPIGAIISETYDYTTGVLPDDHTFLGRNSTGWVENADGTWTEVDVDEPRISELGLNLEPGLINWIRDPWGLNGAIGGTGWSISGTGSILAISLVGRGVTDDGLPYVDIRHVSTVPFGQSKSLLFADAFQIPIAPSQSMVFRIHSMQVVGGDLTGISRVDLQVSFQKASGGSLSNINSSFWPGVVRPLRAELYAALGNSVSPLTGDTAATVAWCRPGLKIFGDNDSPVDVTLRLVGVQFHTGTVAGQLTAPPAAVGNGSFSKPADRVSVDVVPDDEGAIVVKFDDTGRGVDVDQCLVSLFSDDDNYIELHTTIHGEVRLVAAINGSIVVDLVGDYVVSGYHIEMGFRYATVDWALIVDGMEVGTNVAARVPVITGMNIGRDRNGVNDASMRITSLTRTNELRSNADLKVDTRKLWRQYAMGANLAGGDFGLRQQARFYQWPKAVNMGYYVVKMQGEEPLGPLVRVSFNWENMQDPLGGDLYEPEVSSTTRQQGSMLQTLDAAAAIGMLVMLDIHNYGLYINPPYTKADRVFINTPGLPTEVYYDFVMKLLARVNGHPAFWGLDVMNEPGGQAAGDRVVWRGIMQGLIDTVRAGNILAYDGRPCHLVIPGQGSKNFIGHHLITDTVSDRVWHTMHQYFNTLNNGDYGGGTFIANAGRPDRAIHITKHFTQWTEAYGVQGHLGEEGVPWNLNSANAVTNQANLEWQAMERRGMKHWLEHGLLVSRWAGGGHWGDYSLSIHNKPDGSDRPPMDYIEKFAPQAPLVAPGLTDLGKVRIKPPGGTVYPSNVWAMQLYDNKIWVGTGNSGDVPPSGNAGTQDLKYIDLVNDSIQISSYLREAIHEEQIDSFRIIDGDLVFPGIDPRSGHTLYFHRLSGGVWAKHVVLTTGHHCFDIIKHDGEWFAAMGTAVDSWSNVLAHTVNPDGITGWIDTQNAGYLTGSRMYHFFVHSGELYVSGSMRSDLTRGILIWDGTTFVDSGIARSTLFPGVAGALHTYQLRRTLNVGTHLVYLVAQTHGDSHFRPFGLFVATANWASVTSVDLNDDEVVWDLKSRGATAYALTSRIKSTGPNVYEIRVLSSVSPYLAWHEEVAFDYATFARSFEANQDVSAWYFGMGTDMTAAQAAANGVPSYTGVLHAEAGTILKWG